MWRTHKMKLQFDRRYRLKGKYNTLQHLQYNSHFQQQFHGLYNYIVKCTDFIRLVPKDTITNDQ